MVAFFGAPGAGHRRAAWAAVVAGYAAAVWLRPLASGRPVGSLTFALLLGAWLTVLVVATEAVRLRQERLAQARAALTAIRSVSREALEELRSII